MASGVSGNKPLSPMETEKEDTTAKKKEKPEGPGKIDKVINTITNGKLSGVALSVGVVAVAALALFYILPNMLHINIQDAWTSNNSAPVFWAISGIATLGLIGIATGTLGKSKVLREAWKIITPALYVLGCGLAIWYGASTMHTMIQNQQYLSGPMIWAFAAGSTGLIHLWGFAFHGRHH